MRLGYEQRQQKPDDAAHGQELEDAAPTGQAQHERAEERRERRPDDDERLQACHGELQVGSRVGILDHGRLDGGHRAVAERLPDAEGHEELHVRRKGAQDGGRGEQAAAGHEHGASSEAVAHRPREHHAHGAECEEHEHRQVQVGRRHVEGALHAGKRRHVHVDGQDEKQVDGERADEERARPQVLLGNGKLHGRSPRMVLLAAQVREPARQYSTAPCCTAR